MPKVSVIVPVYGVEKYIERCARSLLEQTLDDIEFIFVDDCTPDRSIEILNAIIEEYRLRFAEMNYIVRIERMPTNSGLLAVRRHGIQLATGDYIIHCDSDDWVDRDMYRLMYEKAIKEAADVTVSDFVTHNGGKILSHYKGCNHTECGAFLKDLMFQKSDWAVWNKLVKRDIYDKIVSYPVGAMGEDMVMILQIIYSSNKIAHVNTPLYYYFYNENSITHAQSSNAILKKVEQLIGNYKLIESFFVAKPDYNEYRRALNYIEYTIKTKLNSNDTTLRSKQRCLFKNVELKVLFYPELSFRIRKQVLKMIISGSGALNSLIKW